MRNLNLLFVFAIACFFASFNQVQAQSSLENFKGLKSSGHLPDDFLRSWAEKYEESLTKSVAGVDDHDEEDNLEEFWQMQHRQIDAMLQSGQFSFGDPLSEYLNVIVDTLLRDQPELRKKIRVYLFKSPSVNAFCVADGIIGVHSGLFAHVNSEAELAFVLAHEISHYTEEHLYDRYKKYKSYEGGWFTPSVNPIKRFDQMTARSQDHELDADVKGIELFLKSPYNSQAVDTAFTTLHESYMSYGRGSVGNDFLATQAMQIPSVFFRDEIDIISKEEDYFDETHNHPNISTRRKAVAEKLKAGRDRKFFVQTKERFMELRDLARFEVVREKVMYARYGDVMYDIYNLQKDFPNNKFLELSKVRALYGLASFKAIDRISDVTESPYQVEGPSQQVYHIIKQLNSEQMVSMALHHVLEAQKKYPEEKILEEYTFYLSRYLRAYCELKAEDFKVDQPALPEFNKTVEDFRSERHYIRAQQMHYRDFHRYLFEDQYQNGWLEKKLAEHDSYKDSLDQEDFLTVDEREDREEEKEERLEEHGADLNIRKMVVLDPTIMVVNASDDTKEQLEALEKEEEYKNNLSLWMKEVGIEAQLLYVEEMNEEDIEIYNEFSALEEWIKEARAYRARKITPTSLDIGRQIKVPARYVCRIVGYISDGDKDHYYFGIYDLKKGEVVYERSEQVGWNLSMRDLAKETQTDLKRIYN